MNYTLSILKDDVIELKYVIKSKLFILPTITIFLSKKLLFSNNVNL